ncbi:MAG: CAP domain-containing protein [Bacteroidetes bacterium]|nr:CAP domain-containing protein [Bacteroidota bacterium]
MNKILSLKLTILLCLIFMAGGQTFAQKTYWMGRKDGTQLRYDIKVPNDVATKVVMKSDSKAVDSKPRYNKFTNNINGKDYTFYKNEIGWEKFGTADFTWLTESGLGADWVEVSTSDPAFSNFVNSGLAPIKLKMNDDWGYATVIMVEIDGSSAPDVATNLDGTTGAPKKEVEAIWRLKELSKKSTLTMEEIDEARKCMLIIANEGRANQNYRRERGCKQDLNLPTGLAPFMLADDLNQAAQEQAEYQAKINKVTHDHASYKDYGERMEKNGIMGTSYEACANGELFDTPDNWMSSETHYKPFWNIETPVTHIGFGLAKGSDGMWYTTAVWY